jgi:hypothetical protein
MIHKTKVNSSDTLGQFILLDCSSKTIWNPSWGCIIIILSFTSKSSLGNSFCDGETETVEKPHADFVAVSLKEAKMLVKD